jgi:hypothetical protein
MYLLKKLWIYLLFYRDFLPGFQVFLPLNNRAGEFQGTVGPHPGMQLFGEGGFIFAACHFFVKTNKKLTKLPKS